MTSAEFKAVREAMGLTQTEFGHRLGVRQQSIYRYEVRGDDIPRPIATLVSIMGAMRSKGTAEQKLRRISQIIHLDKE